MRDKTLLVAGASSGIGRAVAVAAAARGARCVLAARRADELERTRALMASPERHVVAPIDFADADGRDLALMRLFTAEGPFDGVVYTVGVCPVVPLARLDAAAFEETMRVNCGGFVALMRAFAARGAHAEAGAAAVAISSVSAREGWAGGTAYCASKGALSAVARAGRRTRAEAHPRGGDRAELRADGHVPQRRRAHGRARIRRRAARVRRRRHSRAAG